MSFVIDKNGEYLPVLGETSGGGGGGTTNHAQLSNLDYANSGHTGFMSSENFLPADTTIEVKLDGTGDFTTFGDAITYLKGKWSNGTVNISIGEGTFTEAGTLDIHLRQFNIPFLQITGASRDTTTLSRTGVGTYSAAIRVFDGSSSLSFKNLTIQSDNSTNGYCLTALEGASIIAEGVNVKGGYGGYYCYSNGTIESRGSIYSTGCACPVYAHDGIFNARNTTLAFSNASTAFTVVEAGIIKLSNCTKSFTSVSRFASVTPNQITASGYIMTSLS